MRRRYRSGNSVRQIVITGTLDTRVLVLRYLQRLLPTLGINQEFLDALLPCLPAKSFSKLAQTTLAHWRSAPEKARLNCRVDASDIQSLRLYANSVETLLEQGVLRGGDSFLQEEINKIIEGVLSKAPKPEEDISERLEELQQVFRVTQTDIDLLLFLYTADQQQDFEMLFNNINVNELIEIAARSLQMSSGAVRSLIGSRGKLFQNGLIDDSAFTRRSGLPMIEDPIREFLSGMDSRKLKELFVRRDSGKRYPLASFHLPEQSTRTMVSLLGSDAPAQILFYGRPGTGKTELARSICRATGKDALFLTDEENDRYRRSRTALIAAAEKAADDGAILIVDEGDRFLNTKSQFPFFLSGTQEKEKDKGWLNNLLDSISTKIIWITNRTSGMEDSVKRRFDYSLQFKDFDRGQRESMWRMLVKEHGFSGRLPLPLQKNLAAEYPVNPGTIATVLKGAKQILAEEEDLTRTKEILRELLDRQLKLQGGRKIRDLTIMDKNYDPAALRLDSDRVAMERVLSAFSAHLKQKKEGAINMNCLFHGRSGTGKTAYARYLAGKMDRELIFKRASDLIDPYVGVTEKKIRAAFEDAEKSGALLFVDEADSFLRTRDKAHRSWEISFVNEFLTAMENFRGILICCTNLLEDMDSASLRRFQWKVGFMEPDAAGRERLYKRYFGKLTVTNRSTLKNMAGLVPGDFKAVSVRLNFLPEKERPAALILEELGKEISIRNGKQEIVGFK